MECEKMIKIAIIYFVVVMLGTLVAFTTELLKEDKEAELTVKRVILLIMGFGLIFFMIFTATKWAESIKDSKTYIEILKTTLINGFYFINSIFLGTAISRKMVKIKRELYIIRLEQFLKEKQEENFE